MSGRLAFQSQLASIMEVLANAAVAEICRLVEDEYAVVQLQMSQCQRENKALKRKLHLLEIKMARGNAERRLRDSAMHSSRPRLQVPGIDRLRGTGAGAATTCTDGTFGTQMDLIQWSGRGSAGDTDQIQSDSTYSKSPDVQLVEPQAAKVKEEQVEANTSRVKGTQEDLEIIRDDGVVERVLSAPPGPRPSLEQQETQCLPGQNQHLNQEQSVRRTRASSRGVEKEEEDQEEGDVVLVKVEEVEELRTATQTGLSIQEGVVESSTDDFRAALAFDDVTHASTHHLCDPQESGRGLSEVSFGSSLWTNGNGGYCDDRSLPGPSSRCGPLPYLPTTLIGAEVGSSGRGLAADGSRGFSTTSSFQQLAVIDLSEDSGPAAAGDHAQGSQQGLHPGQSPVQGGQTCSSEPHKNPKKRVCVCRFCGKGFSSPANLESHLRTHTGERPYGCSVCGKKFSQFWNLKIHRNIHTGERPYQCPLCLERFSDPSNLKKHQKRHHPQA